MTLRDDLIAAKALIDTPEKWAKGHNVSAVDGRYCAATACNDFTRASAMFDQLQAALPEPWLTLSKTLWVSAVFDFNDSPDTTHADIMALFDRAIKSAELQGTP